MTEWLVSGECDLCSLMTQGSNGLVKTTDIIGLCLNFIDKDRIIKYQSLESIQTLRDNDFRGLFRET
jgi:hypothetical protein